MTFEELGVLLKTERERRGIDIATVAEKLRISSRIVISLESGDPSAMPHSVYVRGFIRSYCSFLGMENDEISAIINSLYEDEESGVYNSPLVEEEGEDPAAGSGSVFIILAILVCCAGAAAFWMFYGGEVAMDFGKNIISSSAPSTAAKPAPAVRPARNENVVDGKNASPEASGQQQSEKPVDSRAKTTPISVKQVDAEQKRALKDEQGIQPAPARNNQNSAQDAVAVQEQRVPPKSAPAIEQGQSASGGRDAQPGGKHQIIITAQAECWVHSNADSAGTRQFYLRKGDTFALTFSNTLELKLGNAGSVRIRYDGQDMPPQGAVGQIRTLNFPPR